MRDVQPSGARRLLGGLAWALSSGAAWSGCELPSSDLPVRIVDFRPIVMLNLNGTDMPMLLDSGAFFSMLPESTVAQLNLRRRSLPAGFRVEGYAGRIDAGMTRVEKVRINGVELKNIEFIVGGNEINAGIKGVLGRNFLAIRDTEYDLAQGVVRLTFPKGDCAKVDMAYWAGEAPVIELPLDVSPRDDDRRIRVPVSINGRKFRALLDTGAPFTSISLQAARRAGVETRDMTPVGKVGGAGSGYVQSWTGTFASFEMGGEKISNIRFNVDDTEALDEDVLIGLDYFLSHRIYVSRLQGKVYMTYNGGPVFAKTWNGSVFDARHTRATDAVSDTDADGLARRGAAAATRRDFKSALADLDRACELAPSSAAHFLARSQVHAAMGEPAKQLKDLDETLRLDPAQHEARMDRAELRALQDELPAALADLAALDAALPASGHLRARMGTAYDEADRPADAFRQWGLWLSSRREDNAMGHVYNQRCWLRTRLNIELDEAVQDCRKAVARDDTNPDYRTTRGWLRWRNRDAAGAVPDFDEALKHKPDSAWALYGRAMAQRRLGKDEAAERDLQAARKLQPDVDELVSKAGFPVAGAKP